MKRFKTFMMVAVLAAPVMLLLSQGESATPPAVSVADFGAVGDGVADDTAAFEQAFASLPGGKGRVDIPAGKYRLTRTLTLPRLLTLVGAAPMRLPDPSADAVSLLVWDGPAGAAMFISDAFQGTLANFGATGGSVQNDTAFLFEKMHNSNWQDLAFISFSRTIVCNGWSYAARLSGVKICGKREESGGGIGILLRSNTQGMIFDNLAVSTCNIGVLLDGDTFAYGAVFSSCRFQSNEIAIDATKARMLTLRDCYFEANSEVTIRGQPLVADNQYVQWNLDGCYFNDTSAALIEAPVCVDLRLANCRFINRSTQLVRVEESPDKIATKLTLEQCSVQFYPTAKMTLGVLEKDVVRIGINRVD